MQPDLLELVGVDLYGVAFERVLWVVGLVLAGVTANVGLSAKRRGDNGGVGWLLVGLACGGWCAWQLFEALVHPESYTLVFKSEVVIHTYPVMTAVGFIFGTWLTVRQAARVGIERWVILDLAFWCLVLGMMGARLTFMVVSAEHYVDACVAPERVGMLAPDCWKALRFWEGGLVFYGAFFGSALALWWGAKRHQLNLRLLVDTAVPALPLGHFFGRIGCLAAGCCWGEVCLTPGSGVRYDHGTRVFADQMHRYQDGDPAISLDVLMSGHSHAVHPVQLYDGLGELAVFALLILWRPHKRAHGELLGLWMLSYGMVRMVTESMRGDRLRGYLVDWTVPTINQWLDLPASHVTFLSTSQLIGVVTALVGIGVMWMARYSAKAQSQGAVSHA